MCPRPMCPQVFILSDDSHRKVTSPPPPPIRDVLRGASSKGWKIKNTCCLRTIGRGQIPLHHLNFQSTFKIMKTHFLHILFMDEDEGEKFNVHKRSITNLSMILLILFSVYRAKDSLLNNDKCTCRVLACIQPNMELICRGFTYLGPNVPHYVLT